MISINDVYVSDALSFINTLKDNKIEIDLTITSPPYNKCVSNNLMSLKRKSKIRYDSTKDCIDEEEYQNNQIAVLNALYDITREGGACFYNHRIRYKQKTVINPLDWLLRTKWKIQQEIIWDKVLILNPDPIRFYHVDERIYWLQKGDCSIQVRNFTTVWRIKENVPDFARIHPAPFRPSIPGRIIDVFLGENPGLVFDPYCGVGTALIEAKKRGKKYIGCDISQKYIEIAKKQLSITNSLFIR